MNASAGGETWSDDGGVHVMDLSCLQRISLAVFASDREIRRRTKTALLPSCSNSEREKKRKKKKAVKL